MIGIRSFHISFFVLTILTVSINSCTIEKRRYRKGFHVEWKLPVSGKVIRNAPSLKIHEAELPVATNPNKSKESIEKHVNNNEESTLINLEKKIAPHHKTDSKSSELKRCTEKSFLKAFVNVNEKRNQNKGKLEAYKALKKKYDNQKMIAGILGGIGLLIWPLLIVVIPILILAISNGNKLKTMREEMGYTKEEMDVLIEEEPKEIRKDESENNEDYVEAVDDRSSLEELRRKYRKRIDIAEMAGVFGLIILPLIFILWPVSIAFLISANSVKKELKTAEALEQKEPPHETEDPEEPEVRYYDPQEERRRKGAIDEPNAKLGFWMTVFAALTLTAAILSIIAINTSTVATAAMAISLLLSAIGFFPLLVLSFMWANKKMLRKIKDNPDKFKGKGYIIASRAIRLLMLIAVYILILISI